MSTARAGRVGWVLLVIALVVLPRMARASPAAKLTYLRGVGAEKCPDETELRKAVAARLGFDVFFPWAKRTVVAEITRGPHAFQARLQIVGEDGLVLGTRAISATSDDCGDVVRALALAISIAVDDFGLEDVPPPVVEAPPTHPAVPEPQPRPPSPPPAMHPPAPPPTEPAPAPRHPVHASLGAL